jgi:Flp pilus assembly protein TadG
MMRASTFLKDTTASSAAEMALVFPILVTLLFGAVEVGNYFLSEHVVEKAVRDAARYAGRLPIADFDCPTSSVATAAEQQIQHIARYGDPDETDPTKARLPGWTDDDMATVTLTCDTDTTHSYVNNGLYVDFADGVPVITVSAVVPYPTLFGTLGLGAPTVNLNSTQQAAVFGS